VRLDEAVAIAARRHPLVLLGYHSIGGLREGRNPQRDLGPPVR